MVCSDELSTNSMVYFRAITSDSFANGLCGYEKQYLIFFPDEMHFISSVTCYLLIFCDLNNLVLSRKCIVNITDISIVSASVYLRARAFQITSDH